MNLFFYTFLFIFGTMFGSFASVLIYRIRSGEGGIVAGRSHCKTCQRDLTALELFPILSWVFQGGKCRGCKKPISSIYPILEITTGLLYVAVGLFLISPDLIFSGNIFEWIRLMFFTSIMFFTIIYVFYDILYLEIPESILLVLNVGIFGAHIVQGLGYNFIPYLTVGGLNFPILIISVAIISALYYIMVAGLKEVYDCLIVGACIVLLGGYIYVGDISIGSSALLSGTVAALGVFISFFLQIILSGGRAMGAGDLRIAITMGLIAGVSFAFPAWMLCYLAGSMIGIIIILKSKIKNGLKSNFQHQIPFGPFIAIGYLGVLFFAAEISKFIEWYL